MSGVGSENDKKSMLRSELGGSLRGSAAKKGLLYIGRDWTLFLHVDRESVQERARSLLSRELLGSTRCMRISTLVSCGT